MTEEGTYSLDQGDDGTGGRGEGGGRTSTSGLSAESSSLSPTGLAGGVMREPPDEVDRRSVYVGNVSLPPLVAFSTASYLSACICACIHMYVCAQSHSSNTALFIDMYRHLSRSPCLLLRCLVYIGVYMSSGRCEAVASRLALLTPSTCRWKHSLQVTAVSKTTITLVRANTFLFFFFFLSSSFFSALLCSFRSTTRLRLQSSKSTSNHVERSIV